MGELSLQSGSSGQGRIGADVCTRPFQLWVVSDFRLGFPNEAVNHRASRRLAFCNLAELQSMRRKN